MIVVEATKQNVSSETVEVLNVYVSSQPVEILDKVIIWIGRYHNSASWNEMDYIYGGNVDCDWTRPMLFNGWIMLVRFHMTQCRYSMLQSDQGQL